MKFHHRSLIVCIIAAFLALCSCDPYGGYEYWIDNRSDSTIHVRFKSENEKLQWVSIDNNSLKLLQKFETINGLSDYGPVFLKFFDSLAIFTNKAAMTEIKKNYRERESWSYRQEPTGMFGKQGDNIYRLEINNDDLQ